MKILITGSDGLMGHAFRKVSHELYPEAEFIFCNRATANLTDSNQVCKMLDRYRPASVIHAAACVGGVGFNLSCPAELYYNNIIMNSFMVHYSYLFNVQKMICYSSVCSFADHVDVLKEDLQQVGEPFKDNFAYGYAKRMLDVQIRAYRKQYGVNYGVVIPTNLYGINDNFDLQNGHVIASLIHRCYLAKKNNDPLIVWGDGSSLREFLFADDAARLSIELLKQDIMFDKVLISNPYEKSIREVCLLICELMDFQGEIIFDESKPKGQHRRPSDIGLLKKLLPSFQFTDFEIGMKQTIEWFLAHYLEVRQ
jgi:GDP-L-fucose synthase